MRSTSWFNFFFVMSIQLIYLFLFLNKIFLVLCVLQYSLPQNMERFACLKERACISMEMIVAGKIRLLADSKIEERDWLYSG